MTSYPEDDTYDEDVLTLAFLQEVGTVYHSTGHVEFIKLSEDDWRPLNPTRYKNVGHQTNKDIAIMAYMDEYDEDFWSFG